MKSRVPFLGLLATVSLLLAACNVNLATEVNADGSGQMRTEIGLTQADKDSLASMSGGEVTDWCTQITSSSELPQGMQFTQEERGDETWCIATMPFSSLEELRSLYADSSGISVDRLEMVGGRFYYDLTLDNSSSGAGMFGINMTWQLQAPGTVGDNNADTVDGRTLTWHLTSGGSSRLQAESAVGGAISPTLIAAIFGLGCLCLVGVVVIVVVVILLVRRSKKA
jgi:hypothetical protein